MKTPAFQKLNAGWNADPNAPAPFVMVSDSDILLRFDLNPLQFPAFAIGDIGVIRFQGCSHYRLGEANDEGWYRGQCRYSKTAPEWGEFYELSGPDDVADLPDDWVSIGSEKAARHFLFYFRDDTFECFAADWLLEPLPSNALFSATSSPGPKRA